MNGTRRPLLTPQRLGLGVILAIGVAVRLLLLLLWPDRVNADEATVGLMGLQILRGEFPIFFSGQGYMGGPEAYLTAVVYVLAGVSSLTLKLGVFGVSCLLLVPTFFIGQRVAGWPGGLVSTLLAAIAPPFLPLFGNYPIGGYPEVVVMGSLILLLTLALVTGEPDRATRERRLLVLAIVAGLGWWTNAMILSYLAAAGVFLLAPRLWSRRALWLAPLGFLLGSLPFWIFNLTHAFWSFALFEGHTRGAYQARLGKTLSRLFEIAGVWDPLMAPVAWLSPAAGLVYLVLLAVLVLELGRRPPAATPEARAWRRGVQLLLLFSLVHVAAFALNRFALLGGTQRYLFPLYSALPVLTGVAVLRSWRWSRLLAAGALAVLLLNNGVALGRTIDFLDGARRNDWWKVEPLAARLQAEGVTHAYAGFWELGPSVTFAARERVIVADPFEDRYPPYREAVDAAARVAYVFTGRRGIRTSEFESALRGIGAQFRRTDVDGFGFYSGFEPPPGGELVSLPPDGWRAEASPPGSDPAWTFDRDVDSAWRGETPLAPGMWYRLDLGAPVAVGGVALLPVRPRLAVPRGYRIEVSPDGTRWETVAAVPEFDVTLRWRNGQPRIERSGRVVSRFAPRPVRYVRIVQTGQDRTERWAIAEIFVYGPAGDRAARRPEIAAALRDGLRLEADGRWGPALAAYERVLGLDPESEDAHWGLAAVFEKAGLPLAGTDAYLRGLAFERLGMDARAVRQYEALLGAPSEEGEHSDFLDRLRVLYERHGRTERAASIERRLRHDYAPPRRAEVRFGPSTRLLGFDVEPREPRAGDMVTLSYYWRAVRPTAEDLTVVVHLVREQKVRFGQDHEPLHGRYPTSRWREGELVRERYRVRLPETLPPGEYDLRIGLLHTRTRKVVPIEETALPHSHGHARLSTIRVLPPP